MGPDEQIVASLPGSYGEALVLTDKRVFLVREQTSGANPDLDIYAHWLSAVSNAHAEAQGTGGTLQLTLKQPQSDPESTRIEFAAYDLEKFEAVAKLIVSMMGSIQSSRDPETLAKASAERKCPKCAAAVLGDDAFCIWCGEQLGPICSYCGKGATAGAEYCRGCGNKMLELPVSCQSCGSRITRWQTYCGECGSILVMSCAGCGAMIFATDKHCRNCGRTLGTDKVDPRAARALHNRVTCAQQTAPRQDQKEEAATSPAPSAAEAHNQHGRELFEQEDVEGALREFRAAVALEPLNSCYSCNLAVAYDEAGEDDLALAQYEKTLELDPNDLTALLSLGYMYSESDEPELARTTWNRILEIAPLSAEAKEARDNLRHQEEL